MKSWIHTQDHGTPDVCNNIVDHKHAWTDRSYYCGHDALAKVTKCLLSKKYKASCMSLGTIKCLTTIHHTMRHCLFNLPDLHPGPDGRTGWPSVSWQGSFFPFWLTTEKDYFFNHNILRSICSQKVLIFNRVWCQHWQCSEEGLEWQCKHSFACIYLDMKYAI